MKNLAGNSKRDWEISSLKGGRSNNVEVRQVQNDKIDKLEHGTAKAGVPAFRPSVSRIPAAQKDSVSFKGSADSVLSVLGKAGNNPLAPCL